MNNAHAALRKLPYAAVGGAIGGVGGYVESQMSNDPLREKVRELEAVGDRSLGQTADLAQSRLRLTLGEYAEKHPGMSTALGALGGASAGANIGPQVVGAFRDHLIPDTRGIIKALRG